MLNYIIKYKPEILFERLKILWGLSILLDCTWNVSDHSTYAQLSTFFIIKCEFRLTVRISNYKWNMGFFHVVPYCSSKLTVNDRFISLNCLDMTAPIPQLLASAHMTINCLWYKQAFLNQKADLNSHYFLLTSDYRNISCRFLLFAYCYTPLLKA